MLPSGRASKQRNLEKLEDWVSRYPMKLHELLCTEVGLMPGSGADWEQADCRSWKGPGVYGESEVECKPAVICVPVQDTIHCSIFFHLNIHHLDFL